MLVKESSSFKQIIKNELGQFFMYTVFLAFFFCSLTIYSRLLLKEFSIIYFRFGYGIIQAVVLAKIIVVGKHLRLVEKFAGKPLIIPTLYKSIFFSIAAFAFSILEHFLVQWLHGVSFQQAYQELVNEGIDIILAKIFIVFIVFILFFGLLELAGVVGENKFYRLFMLKKK